ncbi:MAG: cytidylate kinase-like family protein [Deltaproteobacteria bacterium]|nr:cytidylate kinase-like family protein [Deltaproteobacteria bacterium]
MPVISISCLSYSLGERLVHDVAEQLGYDRLGEEVFKEAAASMGVPVEKMHRALEEAPSFFGMSVEARLKCLAHFSAVLAKMLLSDDVLYEGPFGHHIIKGVSHVFKARITASKADRAAHLAKEAAITIHDAGQRIEKADKKRLMAAHLLFGADDDDQENFDLIINTSKMDAQAAVAVLCEAVSQRRYRPMTYSIGCLKDLELASRVKALISGLAPRAQVQARSGNIKINAGGIGGKGKKKLEALRKKIEDESGVSSVEIEFGGDLTDQLIGKFR